MLAALKAAGRRLGIVTSKSRDTTAMAFRAVGLEGHFDVVVTASDTDEHKPSPEPILLCLERLAGDGRRAIYVGDSPVDIQAGAAAGVATAAVAWGVFGRDALLAAGAGLLGRAPGRAGRAVPARPRPAREPQRGRGYDDRVNGRDRRPPEEGER